MAPQRDGRLRDGRGHPHRGRGSLGGRPAASQALWLAFFPVVQLLRTTKFRSPVSPWDRWALLNAAVQITADALVLVAWGWHALAYLGLSYWLSVGFHPVGTRVIQEHFFVEDGQETHSYVGPATWPR